MLSAKGELLFWIITWPFFIAMVMGSFALMVAMFAAITEPSNGSLYSLIHEEVLFGCIVGCIWYLAFSQTGLYFKAKKYYEENISPTIETIGGGN